MVHLELMYLIANHKSGKYFSRSLLFFLFHPNCSLPCYMTETVSDNYGFFLISFFILIDSWLIPALNAGRPWRCFCPTFCHSSFLMLSNLIRNCVDTFTFMEFLKCWTRYLFVICNTCDSGETDMKQLWNSIKQKIHYEKCILKKSTMN